ncbi:YceI family protein [Pedobacter sp. AW31-3R]|uniref:YceI family protein n=1 Tax=Pedobacter sp. AW31-3R TaxID=3445781 RepID=UPI003F9F7D80
MKRLSTNTRKTPAYLTRILTVLIILGISATSKNVMAQTAYHEAEGSQITVNGSSNIHDWTMTSKTVNCDASIVVKGDQISDISALAASITVTTLKSKDKSLDSRAYKALEAEKFKTINFKLTDAAVSGKTIKATGNLTIAGNTVPVTIVSTYTVSGGVISIKGTQKIKFSQFKLKAPSFMLGAMKVTDDLTIDIQLKLKG